MTVVTAITNRPTIYISSTKSKDVAVYGKIKCANGTTGQDDIDSI